MNNYIHKGWSLTLIPPYSGLGGGGMKSGNVFGVAAVTFTAGVASQFEVVGVFALVKGASVFNQGDSVYWDDINKVATAIVGSNLCIGAAENAQLTGDATVQVRLFGVPGFSGQVNGVKVAHTLYNFAVDGGASCTPANSDTIPKDDLWLGCTEPTDFGNRWQREHAISIRRRWHPGAGERPSVVNAVDVSGRRFRNRQVG